MIRSLRLSVWTGSVVLLATGCSSTSGPDVSAELAPPMPAQRIEADAGGSEFNNLYLDGQTYFAGQPTEKGLRDLADLGVTTVVNLRPPAEMAERVEFDEGALVEQLGMRYVNLAMTGKSYSVETVDALAEILNETQGKTLLHCGSSNRVGVLWANYLARHRDVELEEAIELGKAAGMSRESLVDLVRRVDEEGAPATD